MPVWNSQTGRWEATGVYLSLGMPMPAPRALTADELAALAELDARASPRRLVLVGDGSPDVVLCSPRASQMHAELTRLLSLHPGRRIAGEWLGPTGWVRFIEGQSA